MKTAIEWHYVHEQKPDDEITILIALPSHPGADQTDTGFHADGRFYFNTPPELDPVEAHGVFAWAFLPEAPPPPVRR